MLPGRVAATPPTQAPYPPPYIWLDQPDLGIQTAGTNTRLSVVTFPVWIAYDGAVKAQVVGLDDIVAKVWDATLAVAAARPVNADPVDRRRRRHHRARRRRLRRRHHRRPDVVPARPSKSP